MKKYQIIEITWLDSLHASGWQKESDVELSQDKMIHKSVGYFLKEDKQSILIIQSYQSNVKEIMVDAVMEIPKKVILKIKNL